MALTDVGVVRLLIGLTPANPFNNYMTDEEIQWFIGYNSGNLRQAARMAAASLALSLTSVNTREITGDIHVYNDIARAYTAALNAFITDSNANNLPNGLMPYASGISWEDICANNANPDNVRSPLTKIKVCDTPIISGAFNIDNSCGC